MEPVPAGAAKLRGAGLTNLEYAPLCEIMGRVARGRPRCSTARPPTPATWKCWSATARRSRQERWLKPLLAGEIRSCFAMTEPDVASSDATNIRSRIERQGDEYVINGRKWWTSGAGDPRCKIVHLHGPDRPVGPAAPAAVDDPGADGRAGRSRSSGMLTVFGYDDAPHGHAEVLFENVRVPAVEPAAGRRPRASRSPRAGSDRAGSTTACG